MDVVITQTKNRKKGSSRKSTSQSENVNNASKMDTNEWCCYEVKLLLDFWWEDFHLFVWLIAATQGSMMSCNCYIYERIQYNNCSICHDGLFVAYLTLLVSVTDFGEHVLVDLEVSDFGANLVWMVISRCIAITLRLTIFSEFGQNGGDALHHLTVVFVLLVDLSNQRNAYVIT